MKDKLRGLVRRLRSAVGGRRSNPDQHECGQVLFQTAVALVPLLAVVGFAVDGGLMFAGYRRAQTAMDAAAHAASQAIDQAHFEATQEVRLDSDAALANAQYYAQLNSRGIAVVEGVYFWPTPVNPSRVMVAGTARIPTAFWRVVGFNDLYLRVVGTAHPAYGIAQENQ